MDTSSAVQFIAYDPDFPNQKGWVFYDETWSEYYGPYDTEQDARDACRRYARNVLGGW